MAETTTIRRAAVPHFETYGIGDLKRLMPFDFEGEIGTDIENTNKQLSEIYGESGTLCDIRILYETGLRARMRDYLPIPDESAQAGGSVYKLLGSIQNNVTNDACDTKNTVPIKPVIETDRPVRWVQRPSLQKKGSEWIIELSGDSKENFILVPEEGFAIITSDGWYRPDTGTPFATLPTKETAVEHNFREFQKLGYPDSVLYLVDKETSYWEYDNRRLGVRCVVRHNRGSATGNFHINAGYEPDSNANNTGSFYAKRKGSDNLPSSVKVLSLDEYNNLMAQLRIKDRKMDSHIKLINELHSQMAEMNNPKGLIEIFLEKIRWKNK